MAKERKISVRTPGKVYEKLMQRSYELDLNHREYLLSLALIDLGLVDGSKPVISKELSQELQQLIKKLDGAGEK